jgi:hypothetical protein
VSLAILVTAAAAAALLYWFPIRAWYRRSGAARLDARRVMTGDTTVLTPDYEATLAITIDAPPERVWPWLLQMGRGRRVPAGNQWRELKPGDAIEVSLAPRFPIAAIEPYRTLVLRGGREGFEWCWQFEVYPLDERRTRLISRKRMRGGGTFYGLFLALVLQPISAVITRKMLLDVKRHTERDVAQAPDVVRAA